MSFSPAPVFSAYTGMWDKKDDLFSEEKLRKEMAISGYHSAEGVLTHTFSRNDATRLLDGI
jgi:hypothetical protein